jgi:pimeloyl-ACP methyl ester carboxylesterase
MGVTLTSMKKLKKISKIMAITILSILVVGIAMYLVGPKPASPKFVTPEIRLPNDLAELEMQIHIAERSTNGIRPGCEAKIVWANDSVKKKTRYSFVYLHGGTSSHVDGDPVHRNIASRYQANLYLARLAGHGVNLGDSTLADETADDYFYSAEYALAVGKKLGHEVIVMGTSFGGALTTYLASKHPEIKTIVLFSPCIETYDQRTTFFTKPWGTKLVKFMVKSQTFDVVTPSDVYRKYWTTHYNLNFIAEFQNFLSHANTPENFRKITSPTFLAYWYKDENVKDTVASVPAMLKMFDQLGAKVKEKQAFPNAGNHALTTPILAHDVESVEKATVKFLDKVL